MANVNLESTSMFMPMYDVTIQATYCDIPADDFTLMIRGGSGSGNYTAGTYIDIQSGSAPDGMVFDKWTGQIANVENINQSSTRIYMPTSNATVVATFKDIDSPESSSGGGGGCIMGKDTHYDWSLILLLLAVCALWYRHAMRVNRR